MGGPMVIDQTRQSIQRHDAAIRGHQGRERVTGADHAHLIRLLHGVGELGFRGGSGPSRGTGRLRARPVFPGRCDARRSVRASLRGRQQANFPGAPSVRQ